MKRTQVIRVFGDTAGARHPLLMGPGGDVEPVSGALHAAALQRCSGGLLREGRGSGRKDCNVNASEKG